ncbi:Transmembrane protein 184-like protein [Erysiphe neolycopersici]|uniref:Transmembrane protein 184-like protein n=1 Tax=Erysiphe neolycopersici TaxID=212602 RepID=A0A420I1X4_9PEZI|nr:Transmembrane protein 184-like protein [Erysiphe neolycopersici]
MTFPTNVACNTTLEDLRKAVGDSESIIFSNFTFHDLGAIVATSNVFISFAVSFYLIWMHATHYTKPYEQKNIIRILFMIPVYSLSALLSFTYYWHAIYFQVLSDCYEAIAIGSFFALLCHYIAPDLHEQKNYFRSVQPKDWIWPLNWFKACYAAAWRTPRSGLTWFNIIWTGVYQYCFTRVTMTIVAVVTQYFGRYCEASQSPQFANVWIKVIEGSAVTIAMYCLVQFYVQLRENLAPHKPFLKILAIKLVIFLSFWQTFLVSILTSPALSVVKPSPMIAYPDLKVGIPSLLLCTEMAIFSIFHLFAFPYQPYTLKGHGNINYSWGPNIKNKLGPNQGGPFGLKAIIDAMNPWDLVKSFARVVPWLIVGRKTRESDISYKSTHQETHENFPLEASPNSKESNFSLLINDCDRTNITSNKHTANDEDVRLIDHAQPHSLYQLTGYVPAKQRYDTNGQEITVPHSTTNPENKISFHGPELYSNQIPHELFISDAKNRIDSGPEGS